MGQIAIPIYFDYASTLCYVAWRIVTELEKELGFDAMWKGVPIRLRDSRSRPGNTLGEIERMKVLNVAAETGIRVRPPEHWIDSAAALEGSELARISNAFRDYHAGVFCAAFEKRQDIADVGVLAEIAGGAGMDSAQFLEGLRDRRMESRVAANKDEADRFSALGYPTFILGDFPLTGIQPKETMRLLIGKYLAQKKANPGN